MINFPFKCSDSKQLQSCNHRSSHFSHFGKSAKFAILANFAHLFKKAKGLSAMLRPEDKKPSATKVPSARESPRGYRSSYDRKPKHLRLIKNAKGLSVKLRPEAKTPSANQKGQGAIGRHDLKPKHLWLTKNVKGLSVKLQPEAKNTFT